MRPGDHPEFFRLPPPEGRSRESAIRLDAEGRFFDHGQLIEHERLARALASWITRHPDDGRYILSNGYDWTYFTVDDVPFFVRRVDREPDGSLSVELSDGTREPLDIAATTFSPEGAAETRVKAGAAGGPYPAKLTRQAMWDLGAELEEDASGAILLNGVALTRATT